MRVLLVEDELQLSRVVANGLRKRGLAVDLAVDGESAIAKASLHAYDAIVLDRGLPGLSGDEVCERLRNQGSATPILMLTALASACERVEGFDVGADDYLPKPFHFEELVARLLALGRRHPQLQPQVLQVAGVRLDPAKRTVERDGGEIDLSVREFALLKELMAANGAVLSAEALLHSAWDENADPFSNTVRVTMMRLRRKLGQPSPIVTHPGAGYSMR